jgi:S1-C subfamily serine protease
MAFVTALITTPVRADLASTIALVKPAVLIVGYYKETNSPRFALRGTGFVVANGSLGSGNLAVTNAHVLQPSAQEDTEAALVVQLRVGDNGLQTRRATVLEVDAVHDLALLRLEGPAMQAFTIRHSDSVKEGQSVAFTGFPIGGALGFSPVTHRGMVSSITPAALPMPTAQHLNEKAIRGLRDGGATFSVFQLDATAYPGNSGGPLFDPDTGELLGVINMVFIKGTHESALTNPSGISYAIPSKFVLELLQRSSTK